MTVQAVLATESASLPLDVTILHTPYPVATSHLTCAGLGIVYSDQCQSDPTDYTARSASASSILS